MSLNSVNTNRSALITLQNLIVTGMELATTGCIPFCKSRRFCLRHEGRPPHSVSYPPPRNAAASRARYLYRPVRRASALGPRVLVSSKRRPQTVSKVLTGNIPDQNCNNAEIKCIWFAKRSSLTLHIGGVLRSFEKKGQNLFFKLFG